MAKNQVVAVMPEVRALANPKPLRDLARGVAYSWIPEAARHLNDPAVSLRDKIKLWEIALKFSVGLPAMAEMVAAASDAGVQEAKALGLLKQALADPGVRQWALANRPELVKAAVVAEEVLPEMLEEGDET